MLRNKSKSVAVFIEKNNVGVCVFDCEGMRVLCGCVRSICCLGYPMVRQVISECQTLLSNNVTHQLIAGMNLEGIQIELVSQKSLQGELIKHNLTKISAHLRNNHNIQAYLQQFAKNILKYNSLGILLNNILVKYPQHKIFIEDISYFTDSLFQHVDYSREELQFLEISREDIHPSQIKGKGASKEGYSVISAYETFLVSTGSKRVLRYIFSNPTFNKGILTQRYELIDWMRQNLKQSSKYLKYFRNINVLESITKKFQRMNIQQEQWRKLIQTLEAMLQIRNLLTLPNLPPLVADYVNNPNWQQIIEMFSIFKSTLEYNPLSIKNGIDSTLDNLKRTYDNMPHLLTLIARQQQWPIDFSIVFMAQVGYLIKINHEVQLPSSFDSVDWILQFSNNTGKFYSNGLTQALDTQYGDLYGQIQDIEKKVIFDMQSIVVQRQIILLKLYWKICEIECFWGISQISKIMCQPKLSSQALIISNSWHLLLNGNVINNHCFSFCQSQAPRQNVFNSQKNIVNIHYSNRCSVITGPNASGKTVYIKQLGIIVYLTHIGVFVPASIAEIPLIDSIVFVGKYQSIYNDQRSGFQSQLQSLSSVAQPRIISNKALILIDELGAEIDYQNSLKLLYTTIDYLTNTSIQFLPNHILSKKSDQFKTPLVFIITHLSQILRSNVLEEGYLIRFLTMSVQQAGLRLFKVKPGLVSKGYGIKTAAQILPAEVIAKSQKYLTLISTI